MNNHLHRSESRWAQLPKGGLVRAMINQYMGVAPSTLQVAYCLVILMDLFAMMKNLFLPLEHTTFLYF